MSSSAGYSRISKDLSLPAARIQDKQRSLFSGMCRASLRVERETGIQSNSHLFSISLYKSQEFSEADWSAVICGEQPVAATWVMSACNNTCLPHECQTKLS